MEYLWIFISVFGALMQAVRTAAQRQLNRHMSNLGTTYVRSIFGLPVMMVFLVFVLVVYGGGPPAMRLDYLALTFGGATAQLFATMALIYMFKLRNFAIGTMLTKVDILMTAVIGSILFSEDLSSTGLVALIIVVAGVLLMTVGKLGVETIAADVGKSTSAG